MAEVKKLKKRQSHGRMAEAEKKMINRDHRASAGCSVTNKSQKRYKKILQILECLVKIDSLPIHLKQE